MPHLQWCGLECSSCQEPCWLDESIPCSPDCDQLDELTGEPMHGDCYICDAYEVAKKFQVPIGE